MPLVKCPDCENPVSTLATACPKCGRPMNSAQSPIQGIQTPTPKIETEPKKSSARFGDFLAAIWENNPIAPPKHSILNPPWVRCPNCGFKGKAQLKGFYIFGCIWLLLIIFFGDLIGSNILAFIKEKYPSWSWLFLPGCYLIILGFIWDVIIKRSSICCAKCGFHAPIPQGKPKN